MRFKFIASSAGSLGITAAYFGLASAPGSPNFLGTTTLLYFNNAPIPVGGSDEIGATGIVGPTNVTIPAGYYVWSNWMPVSVLAGSSYILSFTVPNIVSEGLETYWDPGTGTHSFMVTGASPTVNWTGTEPSYTSSSGIHSLSNIAVWTKTGVSTSQIYDTHISDPAYNQLTWTTNLNGTYLLKARSSDDSQMTGATAWNLLAGYSSSPATISGIGSGRYVQFQATLTTASPYTIYPQLDNVTTTWPGQTAIVEFSGQYTLRPNYGMFKVLVDGNSIVNALKINVSTTKNYQGKNETIALSAEVKARNSGK